MRWSLTVLPIVACAVTAVVISSGPATAQSSSTTVTVDPTVVIGATNQHLVGFGWNTGHPLDDIAPLAPTTIRIDGALQHLSTGPHELDLAPLLDKLVEIRRIGAEPQVILSYTPAWLGAPHAAGRDPTRVAPSDLDAWEHLVEQVVEASATAAAPAHRFEVWNEPDLPTFWQDTPAAFLEMAVRTHRAVTTVAQRTGLPLEIGGPATVFPNAPFISAYVARMRDEQLPVDYVSWHYYGNYPFLGPDGAEGTIPDPLLPIYPVVGRRNPATSPRIFSHGVDLVRTALAAVPGDGSTPALVLDEWNLSAGGLDRRHDTSVGAAFDAAVLIELEAAGLDRADFYRSHSSEPEGDWGVVSLDGGRKPSWWSFHAWQATAGDRVQVTGDDPEGGLWARATLAADRTHVLLVNWLASGGDSRNVTLTIAGACVAELARLDPSSADLAAFVPVAVTDAMIEVELPTQSLAWVRSSDDCPDRHAAPDIAPGRTGEQPPTTPSTGGGLTAVAVAVLAVGSSVRSSRRRR